MSALSDVVIFHVSNAVAKPVLCALNDMGPREILVLAPLVILTIFYGVYPAPVLDVTNASVKKLVSSYETAVKQARAENR